MVTLSRTLCQGQYSTWSWRPRTGPRTWSSKPRRGPWARPSRPRPGSRTGTLCVRTTKDKGQGQHHWNDVVISDSLICISWSGLYHLI